MYYCSSLWPFSTDSNPSAGSSFSPKHELELDELELLEEPSSENNDGNEGAENEGNEGSDEQSGNEGNDGARSVGNEGKKLSFFCPLDNLPGALALTRSS